MISPSWVYTDRGMHRTAVENRCSTRPHNGMSTEYIVVPHFSFTTYMLSTAKHVPPKPFPIDYWRALELRILHSMPPAFRATTYLTCNMQGDPPPSRISWNKHQTRWHVKIYVFVDPSLGVFPVAVVEHTGFELCPKWCVVLHVHASEILNCLRHKTYGRYLVKRLSEHKFLILMEPQNRDPLRVS